MQSFMRKHRKLLLIIIILTIGLPMLFFGLPEFWAAAKGSNEPVLAKVGDIPIYEEQYSQALQRQAQMMSQGATPPTIQELSASGAAQKVLQDLVDQALFTHEVEARDFSINEDFANDQLREESIFKKEDGTFDKEAYNSWVKTMEERGVNWNDVRRSVQDGVARQVFVKAISAPAARILESDIEKELADNSTKIRMKYVAIEPPAEVTEEEIQKQYSDNKERYKTEDKRVAEFVAVPLTPAAPEKAAEIVRQAREGADFAGLITAHSDSAEQNAGDLGWLSQADLAQPHRQVLGTLAPGEVSDPVYGPGGYFIYKVLEKRPNPDSGAEEVHAQQIFLRTELTPEERTAKEKQASDLLEKAKEGGDLAAAAQAAGLQVQTSDPFDFSSMSLRQVDTTDTRQFVSGLGSVAAGEFAPVINGRSNLFVAKVKEVQPGTIPPLEEVRERAKTDALMAKKQTPEYQQKLKVLADRITAEVKSVDEIPAKFPELNAQVKESSEFTKKDYLFQDQLYLSTPEVYDAIGHGDIGTMGGPFKDFQGTTYFVQLSQKTPPTDEEKAKWADERKTIAERQKMMNERDLIEDYQLDMRQRLTQQVPISIDQERLARILGHDQAETGATTATEGESAATESAPAPAETTETPAEAPAEG